MKYNITTAVLDFDGTIADTKKSILITVKETLKDFGLSSVEDYKIKQLIGLPLSTTFEKVASLQGEKLDKAIKEYRRRYDEIALKTVELFPGVSDTLSLLFENNIKLAIASSKGKEALKRLLNHLGIKDFFSLIAGEQDVANKKPAPDVVELIMRESNSSPKNTLVIGDTTFDIEMGKAAGCFTCAVTYGNHSINELHSASPTFIIKEFQELLQILV